MKQILLCACLSILAACTSTTDQKKESSSTASTTTETEKINYPMPSEFSDTWEMGDPKHAVTILNLYKGWTEGNFESFKNILADSVELHWATGDINIGPKDSILAVMMAYRNSLSEVRNNVHGFLSMRHRDTKKDYVLVWVKEIKTAKDGKKDSVELQENWRINSAGKPDWVYQYNSAYKPPK